jgi:hypothetical protein
MTDDVDPTVLFKIGISSQPEAIQFICLDADRLDHLLSVMRHEQRDVQQDLRRVSSQSKRTTTHRVGQFPDIGN